MKGRQVVVTGGTGALGRAVVEALVARGARCRVPTSRESGRDALAHLGDGAVEVVTGVDLTAEDQVDELFSVYGPDRPLWASVHLVGGFHWGALEDAPGDTFDKMMTLNVRTCYLCSRRAALTMKATGSGGRIVNTAARPALTPTAGANMVAYTAAKAAVAAMSMAMAEELAGDGIWVNAVAPSMFDTPRNRADMPDADHSAWPTPAEVAETIAFLASPENATTRGGVIPVYGRV